MINLRPLTLIVESARLSRGSKDPMIFFHDILDRLEISTREFITQDNPYALGNVRAVVKSAANGEDAQWPVGKGMGKAVAQAHGMTLTSIAQRLGKSRATLYNLNSDRCPPPQAIRSIIALRWFRFSPKTLSPHLFSEAIPSDPVDYLLRLSGVTPPVLMNLGVYDMALPTVRNAIRDLSIEYPMNEDETLEPVAVTRGVRYRGRATVVEGCHPGLLTATLEIPAVLRWANAVRNGDMHDVPWLWREAVRMAGLKRIELKEESVRLLIEHGEATGAFLGQLTPFDPDDTFMVRDVLSLKPVSRAIEWGAVTGNSWSSQRGRSLRYQAEKAAECKGIRLGHAGWTFLTSRRG